MSTIVRLRRRAIRRRLLETASVVALFGLGVSGGTARADGPDFGIDHMWLNFDNQWSSEAGGRTTWASRSGFPQQDIGLRNGSDYYGGITVQSGPWFYMFDLNYGHTGHSFSDFNDSPFKFRGNASQHETHVYLDFMVGRDVGLGMFGLEGTSIVSGGIQYARFVSQTVSALQYYSKYYSRQLDRQYWGLGPTISWRASTPFYPAYGLSFDWGLNGSVLFGTRSFEVERSSVRDTGAAVPRIGGYLGLEWQIPNQPLSITAGYGATATFGMVDSGLYVREHADRLSYGPFLGLTQAF